jgi:hypothetical protein
MPLQLGKDARISAGEESTAGTEVARTAVARLVSTTLQRAIERDVVPHLVGSGAAAANPVDFFETVAMVGGDLEINAAYQGSALGLWLKHAMGAVATTGAGPYAHAFSLAGALPAGLSLCVERGSGGLGDEELLGCKISSFELSVAPGQVMACRMSIIGMGGSARGSDSPPGLATLYPITHKHAGQLSFDSASYTLSAFTLRVDNNLTPLPELGSLYSSEPQRNGFQTIEIEAELVARSDALFTASLASTQGDVTITFTDSTRSLAIVLHNAVIFSYSDPISAFGVIKQKVVWRGLGDGSDHGLLVTLTNANSSAVVS